VPTARPSDAPRFRPGSGPLRDSPSAVGLSTIKSSRNADGSWKKQPPASEERSSPDGKVLNPRWVFLSYWAIIVLATVLFHQTSTFDAEAALMIVALVSAFTFGVFIATLGMTRIAPSGFTRPTLRASILVAASLVGAMANVGAAILAIQTSSLSLTQILTLQGLAESANSMAVARYAFQGTSQIIPLLLGIGYAAAAAAPFVRLTEARFKTVITLLPAITSLIYASVTSARLGFLIAASMTAGGVIAAHVCKTGRFPVLRPRAVVATMVAAALIAAAFIGIGALRIGRFDAETVRLSAEKQVVYTVGSTGAFATWLDQYDPSSPPWYGTATIAGVEYLTGKDRASTRAVDEFAVIDSTGRTSNVYTAFRGIIMDFGIAGGLAFLAVVGFIFGRITLVARRGNPVAASLLGYGFATIFLSAWLATTTFTNVLVVLLIAPIVVRLAWTNRGSSSDTDSSAN